MKTHLGVQQREDTRRDLAERMKFVPPDLRVGESVFYWQEDPSKIQQDGSLEKKLRELLGISYNVTKKKSRDEKTAQQPWQQHHGKANDATRHIITDGHHTSILERFQKRFKIKKKLVGSRMERDLVQVS